MQSHDLLPAPKLYRFYQAVYVIADSTETAQQIVRDHTSHLADIKPEIGYIEEGDAEFAPLHIQYGYASLFDVYSEFGTDCERVTAHTDTHVANIAAFSNFVRVAFEKPSTFPIVPELELTGAEWIRFLVGLAQRSTNICQNTKAYYFLRFPALESTIKDWNLRGGFSSTNIA